MLHKQQKLLLILGVRLIPQAIILALLRRHCLPEHRGAHQYTL